jgi:hypothetical protein
VTSGTRSETMLEAVLLGEMRGNEIWHTRGDELETSPVIVTS